MKYSMILAIMIGICFCVSGCVEESVLGGAAAFEAIAIDSQGKFIEAVSALNEETARINESMDAIDGTVLIRPETLEAMKNLKGRESDPLTWIALASILANMFWGGKSFGSKRSK